MHDPDPKTLRLLVAACDLGSLSLAAEQEHIEPSAISKRIAALEQQLGTPLLVRGRRGVVPTPAGQAVVEHARALLFTLGRLRADLAGFGQGVVGHVRLVATTSALAEALPDDVAGFMRDPAHAQIQVSLEERLTRDIGRSLRDGLASIGVCWDQLDASGLQCRPYRQDRLALAVPVDHPLAAHPRLSLAQTLAHAHVGLPPGAAVQALLQRAAAQAGGLLRLRAVVSTFDAALRVVAAGLAISVIPAEVIARARLPQVRAVPLDDDWALRRFVVCAPPAEQLSSAAARLFDHLAGCAEVA
ncbi:MAG: hypothetical protein RLY78_3180 [Pseudomonadota bacterium]|jgi:DNA-binding transcriptional LysR family regulator